MQTTQSPKAGERTREIELPIKAVKLGEATYGLVIGKEKFIISNKECIHSVHDNSESVELRTGSVFNPKYETFTLAELWTKSGRMNLGEWVHYWGIKQRMASNYALLRQSMREIGVSDKWMPDFGG